jgi:N-acetylglucosaminyldiphosphoundecaprenol N-acetyl-beta-D-mannosaminyltransferase
MTTARVPGPTVEILGIPIYAGRLDAIATDVIARCASDSPRESLCISATGAHGLVTARRDRTVARLLRSFHANLPDGRPILWIGRLKGAREMDHCPGPDFFELVMRESAVAGVRHYLCGGKEGVAEKLREVCGTRFGNHHIVGTFTPPFRDMTDAELAALARDIEASGADVVWVAIGCPRQEALARRLASVARVHFIVPVGAAFDFHTGTVPRAPLLLRRAGLEWLFRLSQEPRRLFKRCLAIIPLFITYNLAEFTHWLIQGGGNELESES